MSVSRFASIRTAGLSGFALLVLSLTACSSGGDAVVLGAATPGSIEVGSEFVSVFGPIDLGEIEISAESIEQEEPGAESDRFASFDASTGKVAAAPVEVAAKATEAAPKGAWLASIEKSAASQKSVMDSVAGPTPAAMGALGGGAGVGGTEFDHAFTPVRKSFATREGSTGSSAVASIADTARSPSSVTSVSSPRKPASRGGALEAADIKRSVQKQQARVRACYERALKGQTHLQGKLMMAWSVERDGTVSSVKVADDQLGNEQVARCVVHAVSQFRFPAGPDLVQVEYPMVFAPGNGY